ncbi:unnamed protein product, partial [Arabidopsis halleri]
VSDDTTFSKPVCFTNLVTDGFFCPLMTASMIFVMALNFSTNRIYDLIRTYVCKHVTHTVSVIS